MLQNLNYVEGSIALGALCPLPLPPTNWACIVIKGDKINKNRKIKFFIILECFTDY